MKDLPLTVKRSIELLGLVLVIAILVVGRDIIMPLLMAFFISLVLLPLLRFFRRYKIPETISIVLCLLVLVVVVGAIGFFLINQMSTLVKDFPQIKENVEMHIKSLSEWVGGLTHISTKEQMDFLSKKSDGLMTYAGGMASGAALTLSSIFVFVGLLPIYIYLMLFYKGILLRFTFMWFQPEDHAQVKDTIYETEAIIKNYLVGLLIQVTYMTILLGGLLLLFGIKHALLIGVIFAILNLIPYVGALLGNVIGVVLTLTSSTELTPVITVLLVIAAVQFLDNNILMPRIVGSKIKINALMAILGVIIGGSIAGISGMFLSMPIIAVMKIIFDHTNHFKQWGILLGDQRPARSPMTFPVFRKKKAVPTVPGVEK